MNTSMVLFSTSRVLYVFFGGIVIIEPRNCSPSFKYKQMHGSSIEPCGLLGRRPVILHKYAMLPGIDLVHEFLKHWMQLHHAAFGLLQNPKTT